MNRAYLDHAASTPLRPAAIDAMAAELARTGNPSSLHASGRAARAKLEQGREQIAAALGAQPAEVVFTCGGTEADNIALRGGWLARRHERPAVAASAIEHPAVAETLAALAAEGAEAVTIGVDDQGRARLDEAAASLARVGVASLMWVNNETGVINDIPAFASTCRAAGAWSHSDAVQAVGRVPVDFAAAGLDLMSVTAHKVGGPVGIGALIARREASPVAVGHGGGQERGLRSGTLAVALVAGFAAALSAAVAGQRDEAERLDRLAGPLIESLHAIPDVALNPDSAPRSPGVVNATFAGLRSDDLLMLLDAEGIDTSAGSACSAGVTRPNAVLLAMGRGEAEAMTVQRFSLGWNSTEADVARLVAALPGAVERARAAARRG